MSEVTITVRGEHETRVAPEEAVAHLSVRAEGPERGGVVERIAALAAPLRDDLATRKDAGGVSDWSSQRVSVWANRPWNNEGKQLALVHYASVDITATFTDFAALSWWISDVAERDGVQVDSVTWRLTPATAKATRSRGRRARRQGRRRPRDRVRLGDRTGDPDPARDRRPRPAHRCLRGARAGAEDDARDGDGVDGLGRRPRRGIPARRHRRDRGR